MGESWHRWWPRPRPTCCLPDGERHIAFARNLLRHIGQGVFCWRRAARPAHRGPDGRTQKRETETWRTGQKGSGDDVERGRLALPCDPSPMPFDKYRSHVPLVLSRPHVARPPVHPGAALGQRRPARRQPGPHRPDGLRAQAGAVPDPGRRSGSRRSRWGSPRPRRPTTTSSASSSTRG